MRVRRYINLFFSDENIYIVSVLVGECPVEFGSGSEVFYIFFRKRYSNFLPLIRHEFVGFEETFGGIYTAFF